MEDLETKVVELIGKFEQLAVDIAPDALELGLFVARLAAAEEILWMLLSIIGLIWGIRNISVLFQANWTTNDPTENDVRMVVRGSVGIGVTTVAVIAVLLTISIWPFVGIFYPEAWIAKEVLGL